MVRVFSVNVRVGLLSTEYRARYVQMCVYEFIIIELRIAFLSIWTLVGGLHPGLGVPAEKYDACQSGPGPAVCPDAGPGRGAAGQHQPGKPT